MTQIYFNPFAFTIEQNNEFLRLGYEPVFISNLSEAAVQALDTLSSRPPPAGNRTALRGHARQLKS